MSAMRSKKIFKKHYIQSFLSHMICKKEDRVNKDDIKNVIKPFLKDSNEKNEILERIFYIFFILQLTRVCVKGFKSRHVVLFSFFYFFKTFFQFSVTVLKNCDFFEQFSQFSFWFGKPKHWSQMYSKLKSHIENRQSQSQQ